MDIQYYHQKEMYDSPFSFVPSRRYTAAVQVPNIKDLLDTVTSVSKALTLSAGIAYVHPSDQYEKTVGRALANKRLAPVEFKMRSAVVTPRVENPEEYIYDLVLVSEQQNLLIEIRYTEHYFRPILRSVSIL